MIKTGAIAIFTGMILGAVGFVGSTLFAHESRISKNETIHDRLKRIESKLDEAPWIRKGK